MISAIIVVASLIAVVWLIAQAAGRGWPAEPVWGAGLRLGLIIAVVRVVLLWVVFSWGDASGWHQAASYVLLVIDAVLELSLARLWLGDPLQWRLALTGLMLFTSFGAGLVIAFLARWVRDFLAADSQE